MLTSVNLFQNPQTKGPLPVMLFIHGGGFVSGSGSSDLYGPEYFLDHDVVLVTINYRLGALGFASLGTSDMPGNFGLKDQHLTLQWVQDNIETFNGNTNSVTIFGESAGSASVAYQLLSKHSYKLFHRAILQSGTQYSPWAFDHNEKTVRNSFSLGKILECPITDPKKDFESFSKCIQTKTPEQIINAFDTMTVGFLPVVEESIHGFLQKPPTSFTRSIGLDIPILIGVTSEEGALFTARELLPGASTENYIYFYILSSPVFSNGDLSNIWNMNEGMINTFINGMTAARGLDAKGKERLQKAVKEYYFKSGRFEKGNLINVTDVCIYLAPHQSQTNPTLDV